MAKRVRFDVVPAWSRSGSPVPIAETHLNYFTCTLGEAARWSAENPHPFLTVNDLIDEQARELRQRPALNIAGDCHAEDGRELKSGMSQVVNIVTASTLLLTWSTDFTYRELRTFSLAVAVRLRRRLQVSTRVGSGTVGLLCSSSPEFILTWLGLMRLGVSVMILAYVTLIIPEVFERSYLTRIGLSSDVLQSSIYAQSARSRPSSQMAVISKRSRTFTKTFSPSISATFSTVSGQIRSTLISHSTLESRT